MGKLTVKFWGVRGSLPSPGPSTARYGGNTPCLEVRAGHELIILDMGSGLRSLGDALGGGKSGLRATFLLSHYHWDHIQGFPFFSPAYDPRSALTFYGPTRQGRDLREILSGQMVSPYFPVPFEIVRAQMSFLPVAGGQTLTLGDATVTACELHHPNGVLAYRIEHGDRSLVYATDTEHGTDADQRLVELSRDADVLVYDAMYTPDEYAGRAGMSKKGWGHSTWTSAVDIAKRARVRRLVLFHHEPSRSDDALEEILAEAREAFPSTLLARERETLDCGKGAPAARRARSRGASEMPRSASARRRAR